jgi:hypothetical protein
MNYDIEGIVFTNVSHISIYIYNLILCRLYNPKELDAKVIVIHLIIFYIIPKKIFF